MKSLSGSKRNVADDIRVICEPLEPIPAVSPGQVLAVYRNLECLGSGVIGSTRCMDDVDTERRGNARPAKETIQHGKAQG
jgi:hypothetical protein